jgi:AcrR family transcriptional regulator
MRTTRLQWLDAGLALIRDGGEAALTIDRLCGALDRTKGAFYHHFADITAYHAALLARWADAHTERPIQRADATTPARRRAQLHRAVDAIDLAIERAMHAWASRAPLAAAAAHRVHLRRIAYLAALRGGAPDARAAAELEYAAFIGSLHVFPDDAPARRRIMSRAVTGDAAPAPPAAPRTVTAGGRRRGSARRALTSRSPRRR